MKKTLTYSLLAIALATSLIYAQQPGGRRQHDPAAMVQRRVQFLTNQLGLTPQQQEQATSIFTNAANGESSMHTSMKTAHESLQTAISNNDQNAISQAATNLGNLTAQSIANRSKAEAAFNQILNPDQQSKWTQLRGKWRGHGRGHRGFGPPPGGGAAPAPGGPGF